MKTYFFRFFLISVILFSSCTSKSKSFTAAEISVVPNPVSLEIKEESFAINKSTSISVEDEAQEAAASYLVDMFKKASGYDLEITKGQKATITFLKNEDLENDAYQIEVTPNQVLVKANHPAGYFYAVQTLRQLLPSEIEQTGNNKEQWVLPCVSINDDSRFSWRGMHMDFSRHFFSIDEVKTFLDYMALYKLNKYHMHLTDDQGWRIEIKKYPLLTEKGAWRVESNHDRTCKELAKEDPLYEIDKKHYHDREGEKMYGGFFTQEQIKEIIAYAAERHIEVIPEIDMPGHFKSAIDNYPFLSCTNEAGWGKTFSIPACLGKETSYEFTKNILSEIADLFPSKYIHIGGDEVNTEPWESCPHCQKVIKDNKLKNEHELQSFFNRDIEQFLASKNKKLIGWDEIVEGGLSKDATMMWWRNWAPKARYIAADNGNDMIITPDFEYYFDFTNEATPLEKVYNYEPVPEDFTEAQSKHVLGVQANLWSEYIPNFKRLQNQAFPRMLALAETGWSSKKSKEIENFKDRLRLQYDRLDVLGVYYYISPVVGLKDKIGFTDKATVELKVPLEGMDIYYTTDGSVPSRNSTKYTKPLEFAETTTLKAIAYRNNIGSQIKASLIEKLVFHDAIDVTPTVGMIDRWVASKQFKVVDEVELSANAKFETAKEINLKGYANLDNASMVFKGYFLAEEDGLYEFETKSDDGSLLYIGDNLVVDNGGNHAPRLRNGVVALKKGWHALMIKFHEAGGGEELAVWYKTPSSKDKALLEGNVIAK